ncbi:unnamed protein product [Heligmosomoides polygyrus]|uniref:SCP domain-containing protein n=1 Tax=Heligmosomoides polygyrus TaxID=6339 RepID=A0A183F937_HELPZ|nr:unnamed protein product [Heligmosomoides polygyrus]
MSSCQTWHLINCRRKTNIHGAPDLRWNDQLAVQAQAWAEKVARQAHISYKELSGVGENITFFPRDLDPESSTLTALWRFSQWNLEYFTSRLSPTSLKRQNSTFTKMSITRLVFKI